MIDKRVQTFGRKRNAIAVAQVTEGKGLIRVNGKQLELFEPCELRTKVFEPLLVVGTDMYSDIDVRIKVRGGGQVSQVYAVRQAIARAVVAWHQKYVCESSKLMLKEAFLKFDRSILVSDPRRCEPKQFGGRGARARRQKSYR